MRPKTKIGLGIAAAVAVLLSAGYGYGQVRRWQLRQDLVLEYREPGDGPRAPTNAAMGVRVGRDDLAAVEAFVASKGLDCPDTSVRVAMQQLRAKKVAEIAAVEAAGGDVDAVSGASIVGHKTKHERNPQVRLACKAVAPSALGLSREGDAAGRTLLVFDSAEQPLRHVSMRRNFTDSVDAALDVASALAQWTERLGPPTDVQGELPERGLGLPPLRPIGFQWNYADLSVSVRAVDFGKRGITVDERIEVPWGVRPDAPIL